MVRLKVWPYTGVAIGTLARSVPQGLDFSGDERCAAEPEERHQPLRPRCGKGRGFGANQLALLPRLVSSRAAAGTHFNLINYLLGHASVSTAIDVYDHASELRQPLEQLLRSVMKSSPCGEKCNLYGVFAAPRDSRPDMLIAGQHS